MCVCVRVQQNFGAVARSVMFLGAAGMLVSTRNCAPLSAAASKASAGALEAQPVHGCVNLPRTLGAARRAGWAVLGADAAAGTPAVDCGSAAVAGPTLLVVGSEGAGLRTNVRRVCSGFVKVRDAGALDRAVLDSLNVSVATGVLLHALLRAADTTGGAWEPAEPEEEDADAAEGAAAEAGAGSSAGSGSESDTAQSSIP